MAFSYTPPASFTILALLICFGFGAVYSLLPPHKRGRFLGRRYNMPLGPQGLPVVGSLIEWLRARKNRTWVSWLAQQAKYGEMTTLSMGTKTWVLLNTSRVANEIITKNASITHERPYSPVASGLVSRDKRLFLQKTENWREGRRLIHHVLLGAGSKSHGNLVENTSLGLLKAYLDDPKAWYSHHYRYPIAISNKVVTNKPLQKSRAELDDLQTVTTTFLNALNASFAEFFPRLNLLPKRLQLWRPHWERIGTFHYNVFRHWWAEIKPLGDPNSEPSFIRDMVFGEYSGPEEEAMYLVMLAISAGGDIPRMTMNAWVMACLAYPAKMQLARDEVDHICSTDGLRLPMLDDLPVMPYICAVVKEVLRWRHPVPLLPQRVLVEDLEFEGYVFPAGTEFLANSIPICRNGYDRAEEFSPERWLESKERGAGTEQDLWQFAFNGGRRSCVGYKLAQKELFVAFARLIYCFDFSPAGEFDDKKWDAFSLTEPFPVKATVRSPAHERLIREEAGKCDNW
ncbi:cytochrome P450 2C31 [Biscogniauxia marginata]|nr:cytochrome P450 2C31 [Biscogniauxia marginata]